MEIRFVAYIFGINDVAYLQNAFHESMPVKLGVHSLSHLCSAAKEEDEYGVVQKDMVHIMKSFLELQAVSIKLIWINNYIFQITLISSPFLAMKKEYLGLLYSWYMHLACIQIGFLSCASPPKSLKFRFGL